MQLSDLRAFVRITDLMSVSAAARALGLPKSGVSRALARLERDLGVVLMDRSTRHLRLTDAGTLFRPHALRILADVDEAGTALEGLGGVPAGTLRVSLPFTVATALVAPMLPGFMAAYPQVRVMLAVENRFVDMPAETADLLIRVGPLVDSDLIARGCWSRRHGSAPAPATSRRGDARSRRRPHRPHADRLRRSGHGLPGQCDRRRQTHRAAAGRRHLRLRGSAASGTGRRRHRVPARFPCEAVRRGRPRRRAGGYGPPPRASRP